jgi:hypothetical protein
MKYSLLLVGIATVLAVPTTQDADLFVVPGSKDLSSLQLETPSSIPFDENELNIFNKMTEFLESCIPGSRDSRRSRPTLDELDAHLASPLADGRRASRASVSDNEREELNNKIVWKIQGTNATGHTLVFNQ